MLYVLFLKQINTLSKINNLALNLFALHNLHLEIIKYVVIDPINRHNCKIIDIIAK